MARVCSAGAVWCAWLLGCTIALTAVPAHADENAAREAFLEGARHYEAGEYERAADAFERSYVERPAAVVLFNLAQALRFGGTLRWMIGQTDDSKEGPRAFTEKREPNYEGH